MKPPWQAFLHLFNPPEGSAVRVVRDINRFGIGFCPGCKRLRGAASLACEYCGNTQSVVPDA